MIGRKLKEFVVFMAVSAFGISACETCKCGHGDSATGGSSGLTASTGDDKYKWSLDTSFEYRKFMHQSTARAMAIMDAGRDTHNYIDDYFVSERVGYSIRKDLVIGLTQGFREARTTEFEDQDRLGQRNISNGLGDLEFDIKYRFKQQKNDGFPVDLAVFASLKAPTGETRNRRPGGDLFESEEQPGSGSWDESIGIAASKIWGTWGSSGAISYAHKGEGSQHFKNGDTVRISVSASKLLTPASWGWKLFASNGLQGVIEEKAEENGHRSPDHGGRIIFVVPGIAAKPIDRLTLSTCAQVPVYNQQNGFHQKQAVGVQFSVGVRF